MTSALEDPNETAGQSETVVPLSAIEAEANRVWGILFGKHKSVRTNDGQYVVGVGSFVDYFVAAIDRLTEGNDMTTSSPDTKLKAVRVAKSAQGKE